MTFGYFKEQGVAINVISGDHLQTVSSVAKQVGIANAEKYIDVSQLAEEEYDATVEQYTVFGCVKPEQKMKVVNF